jgi:small neutral amino acid transporter SnatA (MarC family)
LVAVTRRDALVLRAFVVWTVFVWANRVWNLLGDDDRSAGFKLVHVVLALVSVGFAVLTWGIVRRARQRS